MEEKRYHVALLFLLNIIILSYKLLAIKCLISIFINLFFTIILILAMISPMTVCGQIQS